MLGATSVVILVLACLKAINSLNPLNGREAGLCGCGLGGQEGRVGYREDRDPFPVDKLTVHKATVGVSNVLVMVLVVRFARHQLSAHKSLLRLLRRRFCQYHPTQDSS